MRLSGAGFVNVHYFCAAEYLRLPKFSLTNWYIFREDTQFSPTFLLMVLWIERHEFNLPPTLPYWAYHT